MNSSLNASMLIFTLLLPLVGLKAADDRPPPVVGAIRRDAWYGRNDVVREVERSLGPKKFHFRLPFFAQVVSDNEVRIDGESPETMNGDIAYAAGAGRAYWVFVDYWDEPALTIALRRYLEAKDKRGLRPTPREASTRARCGRMRS